MMYEIFPNIVIPCISALIALFTVWAVIHAILYKRESRASVAWVGLILFSPGIGAFLYYMFGVNRIRRKAVALKQQRSFLSGLNPMLNKRNTHRPYSHISNTRGVPSHLSTLIRYGDALLNFPVTAGNRVKLLANGTTAFPAMLQAIREAQRSIALQTYIFDNDCLGRQFAQTLKDAVQRGVHVRVLIDSVGAKYSFPSILHTLRASRIPTALFLPGLLPWKLSYTNLRNHRKILLVDGTVGFTGGMNIRTPSSAGQKELIIQDTHFQFEGPVVAHLRNAFAEDWLFTTHERLQVDLWEPPLTENGLTLARGILDGPDEDFEHTEWMILGAIAAAQQTIFIQTPYFLPNAKIISALNVAVLKGIEVHIILPQKGNLRVVEWATLANMWQVLEKGGYAYFYPPPFDHSKLMVVDDFWVLVGSSNWDARSLRLNFECNVECYDPHFAGQVRSELERKRAQSRPITLEELEDRHIALKFRDGIARLFSPYL